MMTAKHHDFATSKNIFLFLFFLLLILFVFTAGLYLKDLTGFATRIDSSSGANFKANGDGAGSTLLSKSSTISDNTTIFLPLVRQSGFPLLTGIYPLGALKQSTFDTEMKSFDAWVNGNMDSRSTSLIGLFIPLELNDDVTKAYIEDPLTIVWNNGYTPFINLPSSVKAFDLAAGLYDSQIKSWAKSYKNYAAGGNRFAYIAPLQEMNGYWIPYTNDPGNYILAYKRIQNIFTQVGVPALSVKWVFAPNGWSNPSSKNPRFEDYYPGNDFVDVVAISAYNWGYCSGGVWEEPDQVFNNPSLGSKYGYYLNRLRAMAPQKPIFIAETASSSYNAKGKTNSAEKDRWINDAYTYLAKQQNVRAILYFNAGKECDWAIYSNNGVRFQGYASAVIKNGYTYVPPTTLMMISHQIGQ